MKLDGNVAPQIREEGHDDKQISRFRSENGMSRREFLAARHWPPPRSSAEWDQRRWAQQKAISAVLPGVILTDGREIIDKATGTGKCALCPPTDTVAKLLPGGTSRYDLMISNTFVKGPILGAKAGDEKVRPST
jgi:hypothetical protein